MHLPQPKILWEFSGLICSYREDGYPAVVYSCIVVYQGQDAGPPSHAETQPTSVQQTAAAPSDSKSYPRHEKITLPALSPTMTTGTIAKYDIIFLLHLFYLEYFLGFHQ